MRGLTEERATMPHFAADYDALASVVHDLRGRLGVLEERVRMLEAGRPKPTWGKRCNLKPVPSEHAEFKALLAILQERDDAKHATELAESELAGERQEVEHLRGQLADAIERAEKTAAINDALRQRCHLAEDECDKLREALADADRDECCTEYKAQQRAEIERLTAALARATADAETYLRIGQRRGEEIERLREALSAIVAVY